jgi:hypothetical protein
LFFPSFCTGIVHAACQRGSPIACIGWLCLTGFHVVPWPPFLVVLGRFSTMRRGSCNLFCPGSSIRRLSKYELREKSPS